MIIIQFCFSRTIIYFTNLTKFILIETIIMLRAKTVCLQCRRFQFPPISDTRKLLFITYFSKTKVRKSHVSYRQRCLHLWKNISCFQKCLKYHKIADEFTFSTVFLHFPIFSMSVNMVSVYSNVWIVSVRCLVYANYYNMVRCMDH